MDQQRDKAGAPQTVRKAMLVTTGLAFITGGVLAWYMGGSQAASHNQSNTSTPLPGVRPTQQHPSRSLSEIHQPTDTGAPGSTTFNNTSIHASRLIVNGQNIPLPPNGHVRQTFKNDAGETEVDVKIFSSDKLGPRDSPQER